MIAWGRRSVSTTHHWRCNHVDENPANNAIENLRPMTKSEHSFCMHRRGVMGVTPDEDYGPGFTIGRGVKTKSNVATPPRRPI